MKRLFLPLVILFMTSLAFAGIDEFYTFNATTGTYTPITGTDAAISSDDIISSAIPIGFTFPYGDYAYTEVKISSNGWIGLGTSQTSSNLTNNLTSTTIVPVIAPLWDDCSLAAGSCQYLLSGTAPNRIFTIQYSNLRWNYTSTSPMFNLQVRLYESGKIDFVYGSAGGTPNNPSASIGINMLPGGSGWFYSVTPGTPATYSTTTENNAIAVWPGEGTIYEFNPVIAVPNDLAALSVTGNTTPTAGQSYDYIVTVRNRGTNPQSTYQVKLLLDTQEVGSVNGTTIQPGEILTYTIPWTPTTAGPGVLYGKVVLAGDQNPNNDQTPPLNISVQPEGVQAVTIGAGDQLARVPMDFYWKNSLFECLYYSDELGFTSGTITSLAFYNQFADSPANGATKIWLGSTNLADLSAGWIPSTQLTLVFDGIVTYPAGTNTITILLQTPYMHTPGNLVMMVQRPMDIQYYSASDYFLAQTVGSNRARKVQSDTETYDPANPPASATVSGQFPKTTISYSGQTIVNDLGCLNISGNTTPSVGAATPYTITVKNNGTATQSDYTVKLMKEGGVLLGSVPGTTINSLETLNFTIPWTPTQTGSTYIYGEVELTGDEIATNNQTPHLNVNVYPQGTVAITVGTGNSTGRMPVDMCYKNSLFETVYLASELNIGGLLTDIQFYNNFVTNLPNMPTNIWVGETTQTDLSAGWIPSTQLTPVFSRNVNYPSGQNNILIHLTTPYPYGGGNLVVMVERPMDTYYYSSLDLFRTQTGTVVNRTRNAFSDIIDYDPANPPTATPQAMFPMTTFIFTTQGLGAINGTVYTTGNVPLPGATVTVAGTSLSYTTGADGTFTFPYVSAGEHQVTATKHGYNEVTHTVTVIEDETVTVNFIITPLPQVTVTGRIVGSDQPTVGLANATISLTGYESYQATTNASGQFTIPNVYANHTYDYVAQATGYQNATGQVVVGSTDVNMGDIVVNEMAFPPYQVVATEATDGSNVSLTWMAPNPGAVGEWLHYDNGQNYDSIGTGGAADFDVAIRFPASALQDYAGMSLYAVKAWPAQAGTFSIRVWTGGNASAPATMVVDQPFTPTLGTYNTVMLNNPVTITGTEELWFGYRCNVTGGYPAGYDSGPAVDGFGDMIYFQGSWSTLLQLNPALNYNWNIQGYVGYSAPTQAPEIGPITLQANSLSKSETRDRVLVGYKVYRLLSANQNNESLWTLLTPTTITNTSYVDNTWQPLPSGVYKFAIKAVYTNNVLSPAAFSNEIHKGMMGTLTGTVTEFGTNVPIEGATITAGEYSGTSNAQGVYSFSVYQGTYTVTCSKPGYQTATQTGVNIVGLQTTTLNFVLTEITLPPAAVQAVEASPTTVNITWMAPGSGANISEGFEGTLFPPEGWSQIITVNGPPVGAGILPTWCQAGTIALTPPVPPHGGSYQAAMWWDYSHQDEWLITPQFVCPADADLVFWSYVYLGSTHGDHYYIKVSTDNGNTWTVLWDASTLTGGWNYYTTPIVVPLSNYAGQQIKLAWHADDPPSNDGMWYVWFLDDISIATADKVITFPKEFLSVKSAQINRDTPAPLTVTPNLPISKVLAMNPKLQESHLTTNNANRNDRVLTGYKVWRLLQGQETNESTWTLLAPDIITATAYQDNGWSFVPDGIYKWAVKAVYTGGIMSNPAFSNALLKWTIAGIQAVNIGTGDQQARIPMDFSYKSSLFECLFYPDELGFTSGTITSLAFYNNFADSPANGATKIWLGSTNQADLSSDWIPSSQMTLVFDGNIVYPSGINIITIPLQTPYMHTPGNLVMMVQRPLDTRYYLSSYNFYAQTVSTNRARKVQSNTIDYNPNNPPESATVSGQFPKTTFFMWQPSIINLFEPVQILMNSSENYLNLLNYFNDPCHLSNYSITGNQHINYTINENGIMNLIPEQNWFGIEYLTIRSSDQSGYYVEQTLKVTVIQTWETQEYFNNEGIIPSGWTQQHSGTTSFPWQAIQLEGTNYAMKTMATTGGTANERLLSPVYNLSNYKDIQVSFDSDLLPYGSGTGSFAYTLNNLTYTVVETYTTSHSGMRTYTIPAIDAKPTVRFRWLYSNSTANTGQNNYWIIDNFKIFGIVKDTQAPEAVTGLSLVSQDNHSALLSWNPSSDLYFDRYELYISSDNNVTTTDRLWSVNEDYNLYFVSTTQTRINPLSDGKYWIAIRAVDRDNNASPLSESVYVKIGYPPAPINNFFVQEVYSNAILLSWTASSDLDFAGYRIYYSTSPDVSDTDMVWDSSNDPQLAFAGEGIISTTITGLLPATRYYFILQAFDEVGHITQYPQVITAMTSSSAIPMTPQNLVLTVSGYDIMLNWEAVTLDTSQNPITISYYEVYVSDQPYFDCNIDNLLCTTETPALFLEGAAEFADRLFFQIKAVSGAITKKNKVLPQKN